MLCLIDPNGAGKSILLRLLTGVFERRSLIIRDTHRLDVMTLLSEHCTAGHAVIVALHDLNLAAYYCQRLQLLYQCSKLADWEVEAFLSEENLMQAHEIEINQPLDIASLFSLPWQRLHLYLKTNVSLNKK